MLDRPSTIEDVAEFVMEYINSDVGLFCSLKQQENSSSLIGCWNHSNQLAHPG
jgi:hypothetical protein